MSLVMVVLCRWSQYSSGQKKIPVALQYYARTTAIPLPLINRADYVHFTVPFYACVIGRKWVTWHGTCVPPLHGAVVRYVPVRVDSTVGSRVDGTVRYGAAPYRT